MTTTVDQPDVDEDIFLELLLEEDEPEPCIDSKCSHQAIAAMYVPQCGRHPICATHLEQWKRMMNVNVQPGDQFTVTCKFHNTQRTYHGYSPIMWS